MADEPRVRVGVLQKLNLACAWQFIVFTGCLVASIVLAVRGPYRVIGFVLMPFALLEACQYGVAMVRGRPQIDRAQSIRLVEAMNAVAAEAGLGQPEGTVYVQERALGPLRVIPRRALVVADSDFLQSLNESELHAVAAHAVASFLNPPPGWLNMSFVAVCAVFGAGVAILGATTQSLLLALSVFPFATWGATVMMTGVASARAAALYRRTDAQAAALLGRAAPVVSALNLMLAGRIALQRSQPALQRVIRRGIQPVLPSWKESQRIDELNAGAIPPLERPTIPSHDDVP